MPSVYEWEFLFRKIGDDAAALKSKKGWKNSRKGRDDYGFSALPAGAGLKCNLERIEASLEKLRLFDIAERKRLNEEKDECEKNPYQFDAGKEAVFWTSSGSGAYNDVKAVFLEKMFLLIILINNKQIILKQLVKMLIY